MYSRKIILQQSKKIEDHYHLDLLRYNIAQSVTWQDHLRSLYDHDGNLTRPFTPDERAFIRNELLLCKIDFEYFFERYVFLQVDDARGGIRRSTLLESQQVLLRHMARMEEEMWDRYLAGEEKLDAICVLIHKARQLGFTMFCQAVLAHRCVFYSGFRGLTASVEDDKTQDVHLRFTTIIDSLPPWMTPNVVGRTKDKGLIIDHDGEKSKMMLQDSLQQKGLGQGEQWDGVHFTEVASWINAQEIIQNHFFPSVASSIRTVAFMESTAQGMGNWWHRATEQARRHRLDRWQYVFVPFYAEPKKYMAYPPSGWSPLPQTIEIANRIETTSPEFMGYKYTPTREQLYWYERAFASALEGRSLNFFLANFCIEPEESFQHSGVSIFSAEILQSLRGNERPPVPYTLLTPATDRESICRYDGAPRPYVVGPHTLVPLRPDRVDLADPRGLVLMYEPPDNSEIHFLGADAAEGIPGWDRSILGGDSDKEERDNAACQVIRRGRNHVDIQCAEFAAPIEPDVFDLYVYLLGYLYRHRDEDFAMASIEVFPTPAGAILQRNLMTKFGYSNLLPWVVFESGKVQLTGKFGFQSNARTVPQLWISGKQHIHAGRFHPRSRYLLSEMSYCKYDPVKQRGMAMEGWHDDRVTAMLLSLWAAHNWASPDMLEAGLPGREGEEKPKTSPTGVHWADFRSYDISYQEMEDAMDDWFTK